MPYLMLGFSEGSDVSLRYPEAVRSWLHVLVWLIFYQLLMDELLALDATAAGQKMAWADRLDFSKDNECTVEWTKNVNAGMDPRAATRSQTHRYVSLVNK